MDNIKYFELLAKGKRLLLEAGINEASNDAWLLMENVLGISRSGYILVMRDEVNQCDIDKYIEAVSKRATHMPLQYILGEWEFMGFKFCVDENVLIPRQDTEVLVEETVKIINNIHDKFNKSVKVLDMCTGSGCIGISIARTCRNTQVLASDLSQGALCVARKNAELNGVNNIKFVQGDLFENIEDKYDVIVSNPPYIESKVVDGLMPEVRDFEPRMALDGDSDGLKFYRKIIAEAKGYLNNNGFILFEIGCEQAKDVKQLLSEVGFRDISVVKDLPGLDRVVIAKNVPIMEVKNV